MLSVLFVDEGAASDGDGLAWSTAYQNPQDALSQAATLNADGDTGNDVDQIWIAEGVYAPSAELELGDSRSASFSLIDGVALYGGFAGTETAIEERDLTAHVTTLSGDLGTVDDASDNAYTIVYCDVNIEASLDGFSITGGNADGSDVSGHKERNHGAGICNNDGTLTVANVTLFGNSASYGGGIHSAWNATLTVAGSTLSGNSANSGGGINNDGLLTMTDSTISGNSAGTDGGGIRNYGSVVLVNSTLSENSASYAGGIGNTWDCTVTVTNSTFLGNSASYGGGINNDGTLTVTNSTFVENSAEWDGGGIRNGNGTLTVEDSTLSGNSADCGGGIWNNNAVTLNNSIVVKNTASFGPDIQDYCALSGSHNLLGNGSGQSTLIHGQDGNLVGTTQNPIDPLFARDSSDGGDGWGDDPSTPEVDESANDDSGDLGLQEGSPAIDAGSNALLSADEFDLDGDGDTAEPIPVDLIGNIRVCDGDGDLVEIVDIGAREFYRYPIAVDDAFEIACDEVLSILGADLTANDLHTPGMVLQVVGVTPPPSLPGTLGFDDGSITYTPQADFVGIAWFDYVVESASGTRAIGTVTVNVVPIPGDLNLDGQVTSRDLDIVRAWWQMEVEPGKLTKGDASGDGRVGSADLDIVRANWQRTSPVAANSVAAPPDSPQTLGGNYATGGPMNDRADAASRNAKSLKTTWAQALDALESGMRPKTKTPACAGFIDLVLKGWE